MADAPAELDDRRHGRRTPVTLALVPSWGPPVGPQDDRVPIPWGYGSHGVGSNADPCSRCGKRSRKRDGRQVLSYFGKDGEGGAYALCSPCLHAAWVAATAGLEWPTDWTRPRYLDPWGRPPELEETAP